MSDLRPDTSPYVLSRIYAQGWNAGKKVLASGKEEVSSTVAATRNPYTTPEEQSRWLKGFTESFESRGGPLTPRRESSWRSSASKAKAGIA